MREIDLSLYLVLDPDLCGGYAGMVETAIAAAEAGATAVQLRAPSAKKRALYECGLRLHDALSARHTPLIVNDHVDVALAVGAEGVHVGQSDLPVAAVRRLVGPRMAIGLSVSSLSQLQAALGSEADHYGAGPLFSTATKPDADPAIGLAGLKAICEAADRPCVAIGSVREALVPAIVQAGADGIAVVSAICGQKDPAEATRRLASALAAARTR